MPSPETIRDPIKSPEEAQERVKLLDGENLDDALSLYDAVKRYGISRTALRNAFLAGRLAGSWVGGISKRSLYMRRADIIEYITLPMSALKGRRPVPWRTQSASA